jgi:hypothetical protein
MRRALRRRTSAEKVPDVPAVLPDGTRIVANHHHGSKHSSRMKAGRPKELNRRSSDTVIYSSGPGTMEAHEAARARLEALADLQSVPPPSPAAAAAAAMQGGTGARQQQRPKGMHRSMTAGAIRDPGGGRVRGPSQSVGSLAEGVPPSAPGALRGGAAATRSRYDSVELSRAQSAAAAPAAKSPRGARRGSRDYEISLERFHSQVHGLGAVGRTGSDRGDGLGLRDGSDVVNDLQSARERLPSAAYRSGGGGGAHKQQAGAAAMPMPSARLGDDEGLDFDFQYDEAAAAAAADASSGSHHHRAGGPRSASPSGVRGKVVRSQALAGRDGASGGQGRRAGRTARKSQSSGHIGMGAAGGGGGGGMAATAAEVDPFADMDQDVPDELGMGMSMGDMEEIMPERRGAQPAEMVMRSAEQVRECDD